MAVTTESKKDPYFCPKCKNYFYHMRTEYYFTKCPDCDSPETITAPQKEPS